MDDDVTTLGDHAAIMRRRWRIPVACAVIGILAALALSSLEEPVYRAQSTLLLEPEKVSTSAVVMDADEVATQSQVIASAPVAERVIDTLSLDESVPELLSTVSVEVLEQTRTVGVIAERGSADDAAAIANGFATEFINYRTDASTALSDSEQERLLGQLGRLRTDLTEVRDQLDDATVPGQRGRLEAREQSLLSAEAEIRTEMALNQSDRPTGPVGGQVLREAAPPAQPASPRPLRAAGFGLLLGLLLGVLLAYLRDRVDDGIRDELRLRAAVGDQPVLGRIPQGVAGGSRLITLAEPHSPESEGYRTLAANVTFLTSEQSGRGQLLVVCSAESGEGKTTIAGNVAVTAARRGQRVVLVDADLRSPDVGNRFGMEVPLGLSHVLADQAELESVLFSGDSFDVPGLRILGAGTVPPNPTELLAGPRAAKVWHELRELADLVVVDTAPVLRVADALEIVGGAELTMMVARYRISRVHRLETAVERIRQVGGTVAGVAWCAVPGKDAPYGYGTTELA